MLQTRQEGIIYSRWGVLNSASRILIENLYKYRLKQDQIFKKKSLWKHGSRGTFGALTVQKKIQNDSGLPTEEAIPQSVRHHLK